jgi:hypothetical protein
LSHAARSNEAQARPMIQFDQLLIAAVVCLVAVHLLAAG